MSTEETPQKVGMFDEEQGVVSSTRVKSMLCLVASIAFGAFDVWRPSADGIILCALFLVAAFFPQYLKQLVEMKVPAGK